MLQLEFRVKRLQQCQMVRNEVVCIFVFTLIVMHFHKTHSIDLVFLFSVFFHHAVCVQWPDGEWSNSSRLMNESDVIFQFQPRQLWEASLFRQAELVQLSRHAHLLDCQRQWRTQQLEMRYMDTRRKLGNDLMSKNFWQHSRSFSGFITILSWPQQLQPHNKIRICVYK